MRDDDHAIERRPFLKSIGAGLALSAVPASSPDVHPLPKKYFRIGITGLARGGAGKTYVTTPPGAGREGRTGVFNAHWGAAVLAADAWCKELPMPADAVKAIARQIDLMVERKACYFKPYAKEAPDPMLADEVAHALGKTMGEYRVHGHGVIFGAHAIRALKEHPEWLRPSVIRDLTNITHQINLRPEGRPTRKLYPDYDDAREIIDATFRAIYRYRNLKLAPYGGHPRQGVIRGNFMHWLTHTDAILELHRQGLHDLARRGHRGLRKHIDRHPPARAPRDHEPKKPVPADHFLTTDYWTNPRLHAIWKRDCLSFAHALKQTYSYLRLRKHVTDRSILPVCDHLVLLPFADHRQFG